MGLSHIYCPDGVNNALLSQGYIPAIAPTIDGQSATPRAEEGVRSLCPAQGSKEAVASSQLSLPIG